MLKLYEVRSMRNGNATVEALFPVEGIEYSSMAALERELRNNPERFKDGALYTLVDDRKRIGARTKTTYELFTADTIPAEETPE